MTRSTVDTAPMMVVVSGDFGELGAALYWLDGLQTRMPQVVLLPAVLAEAMPDDSTRQYRVYQCLADISAAVLAFAPDTVLLASGYLLSINTGLTTLDVLRLLRQLHRQRVTVLTSDPFLGLSPWPAWASPDLWRRPGKRTTLATLAYLFWLAGRVWPFRRALHKAWHVYPAPTNRLPWLNSGRQRAYRGLMPTAPAAPVAGEADQTPVWLFVLARVDHILLLRQPEGLRVIDTLLQRLSEVEGLGRQAVVVGPPDLLTQIQNHFGAKSPVLTLGTLSHTAYLDWLQRAELAFFWNFLSFSLIHRVLAGRPVVFFDAGHFTHLFPNVAAAGERLFYDGWQPPLRRMDQPFYLDEIQADARAVARRFQVLAAGLQSSPSPAELLAEIKASSPR